MSSGTQQRVRLALLFMLLLLSPAMTAPVPPVPLETTFLLGGFRHIGLSTAVQEAPKLLRTASKAPKYIKSAVKEAPKALHKLGPEDFLGSGVKRKSLTGLYSVAGAVGLGASSIAYNGINMKARQSEAIRKQHSRYSSKHESEDYLLTTLLSQQGQKRPDKLYAILCSSQKHRLSKSELGPMPRLILLKTTERSWQRPRVSPPAFSPSTRRKCALFPTPSFVHINASLWLLDIRNQNLQRSRQSSAPFRC